MEHDLEIVGEAVDASDTALRATMAGGEPAQPAADATTPAAGAPAEPAEACADQLPR